MTGGQHLIYYSLLGYDAMYEGSP